MTCPAVLLVTTKRQARRLEELTLFAYFALILSSIATELNLEKSSGEIWIRSEIVAFSRKKQVRRMIFFFQRKKEQ